MPSIKTFVVMLTTATVLTGCANLPLFSQDKAHEPSTYARYVPERLDDFAWENDLVAFRAYGPALRSGTENSGVDCWLKRVDYPIINLWYQRAEEQKISYHKDNGEGLDNYHVGSSAGCGNASLWLNGERQPLETYVDWKIIKQTKEESIFDLFYEKAIQGDVYKKQKRVTIKLGSRLFSVETTFWKNGELAKHIPIAIALSTHDGKGKAAFDKYSGYLSVWEHIGDSDLGTGVKLNSGLISDIQVINDQDVKDDGHVIAVINTDEHGKVRYSAGYGWAKTGDITTEEKWINYLKNYRL